MLETYAFKQLTQGSLSSIKLVALDVDSDCGIGVNANY